MCLLPCQLQRPKPKSISMACAANVHRETQHYLQFVFLNKVKGVKEEKKKQVKLTGPCSSSALSNFSCIFW